MVNLIGWIKSRQSSQKNYLGLFLKEDQGVGIIFSHQNNELQIVSHEKFNYTNGWDNLTEDVDNLLVHLEKQVKTKLNETIFFFYSSVIDSRTSEIRPNYYKSVKNLVKNLDLNPLGYIEISDAVLTRLQKKEGSSLNSILLELDKTNCSFFVIKNGKKIINKTIARTDNLIDDLTLCFNQLKTEIALPSRLILYNSVNLEKQAAVIVSHRWSSSIFVQLPRVEIISEVDIYAGLLSVFSEQITSRQPHDAHAETEVNHEKLGFMIGGDVSVSNRPLVNVLPGKNSIKWPFRLPQLPRLPGIRLNGSLRYLAGIAPIIIMILLIELFVHRATITVFFPNRVISQDVDYVSDQDATVLPIQSKSLTVDVNQSKLTNGKKAIGEKARGEVTIHNFNDQEKTFDKATLLASGNLQFTLEDNVKASAATDTLINGDLVRSPGKAKVRVTAVEIGSEGNLPKGTRFAIGDYSSSLYFGLNESALTGGSKREVRTVAKQDLSELETAILEKTKKEYPAKLKATQNNGSIIIDPLTEVKLTQTKYSKEIGEEAENLSLSAKVAVTYYYVDKTAFFSFLRLRLKDEIGSGFSLSNQTVSYHIKRAEKKDDSVTIDWSINGTVVKNIEIDRLQKQLVGKNRAQLENILKNDYQATGYTLNIQPDVLPLNSFTPWRENNIKVIINSFK